jgi:hypothetical protein
MPFSRVGDTETELESVQDISDKGGHILLCINTNKKVELAHQGSLFSRTRFSGEKGRIACNSKRRTLRVPVVNVCMCKRQKIYGTVHPGTGHADPERELRVVILFL